MRWLSKIGPGLLYAGAAVGVSHLVQSTKAGAHYGYVLILAIILVHVLKYPFLKLGPLYTQRHQQTLIAGICEMGKGYRLTLIAFTLSTMFIIQAAVTMVTAALIMRFTDIPIHLIAAGILLVCMIIISWGRYKRLDQLMKVIIVILSLSTLVAVVSSFPQVALHTAEKVKFNFSNPIHFGFLIAFLGWMPAPLDITLWQSVWTKEKMNTGIEVDEKSTLFDFNLGFFGTAILAIAFLTLGANMFYGSGITLSPKAGTFANQLLDMYSDALGSAFFVVAAIAAITTMFSTTLTCLDAMPKVLNELVYSRASLGSNQNATRLALTLLTATGGFFIILYFKENLGKMVTFATVVSFLTAPIIGGMCILLEKRSSKPIWSNRETILAWIGWTILTLVCLLYIWELIGNPQ
jgi:Mn2+/Fe2+ NRAMP family transporter